MNSVKLLALDLDGTLLNSQKELTPRTRDALYAAAEAGAEIVPTTGRFFTGMPEVIQKLPFLHYAITINGAQVYDIRAEKAVSRAEIPLETALRVLEYLDGFPVIYDCYQDNLTPTQKTYVTKLDTLTAAEAAYKALVDQKAADDVMEKINEIGEVTLDSKTAIEAARAAYDALTNDQKPLVENYNVLTAAEAELARLEAEAKYEADLAAAAQVDEMIERLFPVNRYSGPAIRMARAAYDALTEDQKALVKHYDDLVKAEAEFAEIPPITPVGPSKPSKPSTPDTSKDNLPFTDVASGSWYYDGVKYACDNGLMNGTSANAFSPNADTTRSMIVTILARMEGVNTSGGATWYTAGRAWAMENGISDGTNMEGKITREQLAAMLYRYAKMKGYDVSASASLSGYTDASSVSGWAKEAMQWAVGSGLIQGSGNALTPQANASRAQIATILMRFAQSIAK